jgi:hypothetical protein
VPIDVNKIRKMQISPSYYPRPDHEAFLDYNPCTFTHHAGHRALHQIECQIFTTLKPEIDTIYLCYDLKQSQKEQPA